MIIILLYNEVIEAIQICNHIRLQYNITVRVPIIY